MVLVALIVEQQPTDSNSIKSAETKPVAQREVIEEVIVAIIDQNMILALQ